MLRWFLFLCFNLFWSAFKFKFILKFVKNNNNHYCNLFYSYKCVRLSIEIYQHEYDRTSLRIVLNLQLLNKFELNHFIFPFLTNSRHQKPVSRGAEHVSISVALCFFVLSDTPRQCRNCRGFNNYCRAGVRSNHRTRK